MTPESDAAIVEAEEVSGRQVWSQQLQPLADKLLRRERTILYMKM